MLNFWNTCALIYLFILLIGTAWTFDDPCCNKDKSIWRLNVEIFFLQAIAYMWIFSMIAFPVFLILGDCASKGDMWGLIPIK